MTDIILSSFLSLFALFGKEERVDESRARDMLVSYLRHHFGIRNIDAYLDFYSDMRGAYEMTPDLNTSEVVASICSTLHGSIRSNEESLLLLRVMEFSVSGALSENPNNSAEKVLSNTVFATMAKNLHIAASQFKDFKGYVDFNEGAIRYSYTTADGIRVISTIVDVFFLKTKNTITYDDTTKTTVMDNTMYQFTLAPPSNTATVKVMAIVHAKDLKYFINLTAMNVPVSVTRNGYTFAGEDLKTIGTYITSTDSLGSRTSTTDKYPFKTFNAVVDLENDSIIANFMMGSSATVYATGRTYPNYSAY